MKRFPALPRMILIFCVLLGGVFTAWAEPPANSAPRWWKGNLHTHTLWSDGNDFPEMAAQWYREHGYHFLALSDHNVLAAAPKWMKHADIVRRGGSTALEKYRARFGEKWVETRGAAEALEVKLRPLAEFRALVEQPGEFLMIPGEEISDKFGKLPIHMNASNLREALAPLGGGSVREVVASNLRQVEEQSRKTGQPMLAHLNHPNFGYAVTAEDMAAVLEERFFEVYNGHPSVNHEGDAQHAPVERLWDIANTLRIDQLQAPPLFGLGTDDTHHYHQVKGQDSTSGRGWIQVRAAQLGAAEIIAAIKQGDFYASSGVVLANVQFEAKLGRLALTIEPQANATFHTEFIGTLADYQKESTPVADAAGKPLAVTRKYSADVGRVLAQADGLTPVYTLTGKELYVRAVVTSSLAHPNPSVKGQKQQAWTQPVGWESRLQK